MQAQTNTNTDRGGGEGEGGGRGREGDLQTYRHVQGPWRTYDFADFWKILLGLQPIDLFPNADIILWKIHDPRKLLAGLKCWRQENIRQTLLLGC